MIESSPSPPSSVSPCGVPVVETERSDRVVPQPAGDGRVRLKGGIGEIRIDVDEIVAVAAVDQTGPKRGSSSAPSPPRTVFWP